MVSPDPNEEPPYPDPGKPEIRRILEALTPDFDRCRGNQPLSLFLQIRIDARGRAKVKAAGPTQDASLRACVVSILERREYAPDLRGVHEAELSIPKDYSCPPYWIDEKGKKHYTIACD